MNKYKVISKSITNPVIKKASKTISKVMFNHGSKILTAFGISGFITSIVWTSKIAPTVKYELESEKEKLDVDKLHPIDTIKISCKNYMPVIFLTIISSGCIIGGHVIDYKKYSALAAMYTLSESTLREYMAKSIETVGKDKVKEINDGVIGSKINNKPLVESEIIDTGTGVQLCYDPISDKYFYSSAEYIKNVFNELNFQINRCDDVTPNDILYELKLGKVLFGDDFVWNLDNTGLIDYSFVPILKDGKIPCLGISYGPKMPKYEK